MKGSSSLETGFSIHENESILFFLNIKNKLPRSNHLILDSGGHYPSGGYGYHLDAVTSPKASLRISPKKAKDTDNIRSQFKVNCCVMFAPVACVTASNFVAHFWLLFSKGHSQFNRANTFKCCRIFIMEKQMQCFLFAKWLLRDHLRYLLCFIASFICLEAWHIVCTFMQYGFHKPFEGIILS